MPALVIALLSLLAAPPRAAQAPPPARKPPPRPSTRVLAGERLVASLPGTSAPTALLHRIHAGRAAGVILFTRNVRSRGQLRSLTDTLEHARPDGAPPLLLMIDQEGGIVKRLQGAPRDSPAQLGRIGDPRLARSEGVAAAANLRGVGINVDLAPVVDLARPGSIMNRTGRSFSGDPSRVSRIAGAFAAGLAAGHVAATAKHFPGLGDARGNEDLSVNRIAVPLASLRRMDEVPFGALGREGVPLVMVSTARYPALDSRPALFSSRIATGELRGRLGFEGVAISDDLDTPAAQRLGSPGRRAVASAAAGLDLLMFAQSYPNVGRAESALVEAVRSGRLARPAFETAAERIMRLRESLRR
jgi:beta-N-acetylhexosaminidase